jgi:hypothetical protein
MQVLAVERVQVITRGELPFSKKELEAALALRLHDVDLVQPIEVRASGAGGVEVQLAQKRRVVSMLGRRGTSAARHVAQVIADLVRDELSVPLAELAPLEEPPREEAPPVQETSTATVAPLIPEVAVARAPQRVQADLYTFALAVVFAGGSSLDRAGLGVELHGSLHLWDGARLYAGAGFVWSPQLSAQDATIAANNVPLRAGLAWRFQALPVETRAGLVLTVLQISGRDGAETVDRGELYAGAFWNGSYFQRLNESFDLLFSAGVELYPADTTYLAHGQRAFSTDRLAVHASVGLAFGGGAP